MLSAIVCVDLKLGIGKDGDLLFDLKDDKEFFRKMTTGSTMIMGRKTFESLPQVALKNRKSIVLTNSYNPGPWFCGDASATFVSTIQEALNLVKDSTMENFIIGGGEIYKQFLPYCDKIYMTQVLDNRDADTFFPDIDADTEHWRRVEEDESRNDFDRITDEWLTFRFYEYERIKPDETV